MNLSGLQRFLHQYKYILLLLFVAIIAYYPTLFHAPKYDMASQFFPNRLFMFEAISEHIFPIWLPYQSLGVPVHYDPQYNVFYLPVWLLSIFGGYKPMMWGVEVILHFFMGGVGFYLLTRQFVKKRFIAFVIASLYLCSGFFAGNIQHLSWIIAGAWLPWVIHYMLKILTDPSAKNALLLAIFASFLFTGGYPIFTFMALTLFVVLIGYVIIVKIRNKEYAFLKKTVLFTAFSGIVCVLLSLPALLSYWEAIASVTRGDFVAYEKSSSIPFTPQNLLSLLFPLISCSENGFTGADISMGSIYTGIITLYFLGIGLFKKKSGIMKVLLYCCLASFLISFGSWLPFHKWAYYLLPYIRMLLYPALFRYLTIVGILLIAAVGMESVMDNFSRYRKSLLMYATMLSVLFLGFALFLLIRFPIFSTEGADFQIRDFVFGTIHQKFFFQSILNFLCLAPVIILTWLNKKYAFFSISAILILDLMLNVWICIPHTGYIGRISTKQFGEMISYGSKNYPIPERITSDSQLQYEKSYQDFWLNLGIFEKEIEWNSYNPLIFKEHQKMIRPHIDAGKKLHAPSALFLPRRVIYSEEALLFSMDTFYTQDNSKVCMADTAAQDHVRFLHFKPGYIVIESSLTYSRPVVIAQNFHKNWIAHTDSEVALDLYPLNYSLIAVNPPAGKQIITLRYHRPDIKIAFGVEIITLLSCILFLIIAEIRRNR